ncbi:hypothetical protein PGB90_002179 [Kerria lacca]
MSDERWYFSKEQLENSPSRRCGLDADKELSHRQQAANFIQDMGQRLQVTQLCINTAIVYMHRFYCFHSFTLFHRNSIASASLFLAAKVEEQPRKLEHIIKVAQLCLQKSQTNATDRRSEVYVEQAQELVMNENILLMTLGFDVAIEHPHAFIVKFCHIANASKDLSQTSYFMASNSLHLTTMCLQYKPTVVACFCIHLVCKWSNWQIPKSKENLPWYSYIDVSVTEEQLEQLTNEFLVIFDKCPSRLKKKIQNTQLSSQNPSISNYPFDADSRKPNSNSGQSQHFSNNSNAAASLPSLPQHKIINDNQNQAGNSKNVFSSDHKKSNNVAGLSHHQQAKSVVTTASCSASVSSSVTTHDNIPPVTKLPNSSQNRPVVNHLNTTQTFNAVTSSSYHSHKSTTVTTNTHSTGSTIKAKMVTNHGIIPKDTLQQQPSRTDHRKPEVKLETGIIIKPEPNVNVKQEPSLMIKQDPGLMIKQELLGVQPATAITNNHHSKHTYKKGNDFHQEINARVSSGTTTFVSTSHSDIISNVVKEVAMAKQNEKQRTVIKNEPSEEETVKSSYVSETLNSTSNVITKVTKSHSIFSPPLISHYDNMRSPVESRTETINVKTEPFNDKRSGKNRNEAELIPVIKKLETVAGYEDILKKNLVSLPLNSLHPSSKHDFAKEKKNTPVFNTVNSNMSAKEEISEYDYCKSTNGSQLSHVEEHLTTEKTESSECSSNSHKKKKKHKEKDKHHDKEKRHHKEKKRHKEEKRRHHKEHSIEKDTLKEPGPIKITIPKEKLVDIPMKLKIKINKEQMLTPAAMEDENSVTTPVNADFKLKISKDKINSRKRNRELESEDTNKKFVYDASSSHNGYKEYKTS